MIILIGASLLLALFFLLLFVKAGKKGQFEDVYTPSVRMLFDDEIVSKQSKLISEDKNQTLKK
jgi:cbb3-type cytochrome oxidase maturation protein